MKDLIKKLVLNEANIELAQNYNNDEVRSPLILQLQEHSVDLANLACATTDNGHLRRSEPFRQKVRMELMPLLPCLSNLEGAEDFFLHRALNTWDQTYFSKLVVNNEFDIKNQFMSFYLNGIGAGGVSEGCQIDLICESFGRAKFLGNLSQVPSENEVLIEEGCRYRVLGIFETSNDLLNSGLVVKKRTISFLEFNAPFSWMGRTYILIEAL